MNLKIRKIIQHVDISSCIKKYVLYVLYFYPQKYGNQFNLKTIILQMNYAYEAKAIVNY